MIRMALMPRNGIIFLFGDQGVDLPHDVKAGLIGYQQGYVFPGRSLQCVFCRLGPVDEDDSGVLLQAGHRDNVLMDLSRDPDIPFLAVSHDVAQKIARVPPAYGSVELVRARANLQVQKFND